MSFMGFDLFKAIALGLIAGLTEFVPVSSTGHLLLAQRFFGFTEGELGDAFPVMIRLGALLALLSIYFPRLWRLLAGMSGDPAARHFAVGMLVAFLPAAVVGALAHAFIGSTLLNAWIVCFALIVGGAVLLWVDQLDLKPRRREATGFPLPMYLVIGLAQCLALIPGVSRSGASIVAAMLLGAERRAAVEFSFWLAMPTLAGVIACDLYGNREPIGTDGILYGALGCAAAFVAAWLVVKSLLDFVSRHGFTAFAWWRVIVGSLGLVALALGH
jgi:undecaprenyl-diphosphatase